MNWSEFSLAYALSNLLALTIVAHKKNAPWAPILRAAIGATAILLVFDALAENRDLWSFPQTWKIEALGIPVENVLIVIGSTMNSLLWFLLLAVRRPVRR